MQTLPLQALSSGRQPRDWNAGCFRGQKIKAMTMAMAMAMAMVDDEEEENKKRHRVRVHDRERGVVHEFEVKEDEYILERAEEEKIRLPFSCRHGCCTACAVRVKSGKLSQPEALGISPELKAQGYGLLCVGYALSDLDVETQDEDEVYWKQFGRFFAKGPVERDDYALELALGDE